MANGQSDGSIILSTKVDTTGAKKGLGAITKMAGTAFAAVGAAAATATVAITKMAVSAYAEFEQLAGGAKLLFGEAYDYIIKRSEDAFATVQMSQNEYLRQVNGFAVGLKTALGGNERAAAQLADRIIRAEADVVAATGQTQELVQYAFNGIMKSNYTMVDNLMIGITPTKEGYQEMIDKVNAWNEANGRATKYQMGNLADMQSALVDYIEMVGMKGYAEREAAQTIQGAAAMTKAAWENVLVAISSGGNIDRAVNNLVYSISRLFQNLGPVIERSLIGIGQMISAIASMVVESVAAALIRAIPSLVGAVYDMIIGIGKGIGAGIVALITGKSTEVTAQLNKNISPATMAVQGATEGMQSLGEETKKTGKETKKAGNEAKKAGKEAKKALASFDELSILADNSSNISDSPFDDGSQLGGAGGSSGGALGGAGGFGGSFGGGFGGGFGDSGESEEVANSIDASLEVIKGLIGGALVAIGLMLVFSGHIPLGIGLIALGAAGMVSAASNIDKSDLGIEDKLSALMTIIGFYIFAVGLVLFFKAPAAQPLALGMMIAGAGIMAIGAAQMAANEIGGEVGTMLHGIIAVASGLLLAIGLLMLFAGQITPVSIGLVIAGAVGLASEIAVNKDQVKTALQGWVGAIVAIISALALVIGLIMLFAGHITPLSIGLIFVGAAGLVTTYEINKDKVKHEIETFITNNSSIIIGVAIALIVLGMVLLLTGVGLPLAIGLIVAGGGALAAEEATNPGAIKQEITDFLRENSALVVGIAIALIVIGVVLLLTGVGMPLAIGLIVAGGGALAATETTKPGSVKQEITNFLSENSALVVGIAIALIVIGIILLFTGVGIPLAIGMIIAGGGALAAEVALNWEYIKTSISNFFTNNAGLIVGVSLALVILGIVLLFTGVGVPLAIGLIIAGGGALAAEVALNWNFIVDKLTEIWGLVKEFWNTYIAPVFTKDWWLDLATKAGNGILEGFEGAINGVITMFENMVNWVINGINKISFDVPEWLGGGHFGFNLSPVSLDRVKIPKLAQGTVVPPNKEFMAILGDNTREHEIVSPISTMKQAVMEAMLEMGGTSGGDTTIILEMDSREFGHAVIKQGQREAKRLGTRLVMA